jgi:hypothetical protein
VRWILRGRGERGSSQFRNLRSSIIPGFTSGQQVAESVDNEVNGAKCGADRKVGWRAQLTHRLNRTTLGIRSVQNHEPDGSIVGDSGQ